jgi:hypothetical protein
MLEVKRAKVHFTVQFFLQEMSHNSKIYNTKYTKYDILERRYFLEIVYYFANMLTYVTHHMIIKQTFAYNHEFFMTISFFFNT